MKKPVRIVLIFIALLVLIGLVGSAIAGIMPSRADRAFTIVLSAMTGGCLLRGAVHHGAHYESGYDTKGFKYYLVGSGLMTLAVFLLTLLFSHYEGFAWAGGIGVGLWAIVSVFTGHDSKPWRD